MNQENLTISFCIVCLNNFHELKETLLKNLEDNYDYSESEFILLDYHSEDKTGLWLNEQMKSYLVAGKIAYYKIVEPSMPWLSCLRNSAAKLTNGDIICYLSPNDYTGAGFASYLNKIFKENNEIVLVSQMGYSENISARICVSKSIFLKFHGFDERIDKAGFEEHDLLNRLKLGGIKQINIKEPDFLRSIPGKYIFSQNDIYQVFVNYISPSQSELILLFQNGHYKKGLIINNSVLGSDDYRNSYKREAVNPLYSIEVSSWSNGLWKETMNDSILFSPLYGEEYMFLRGHYPYDILLDVYRDLIFLHVSESEVIDNLFIKDQFFYSGSVTEQNLKNKQLIVNPDGFGQCSVLRYFDPVFQI